jgi:hypothetical protein
MRHALFVLCTILVAAGAASAQITSGQINGTVVDSQGLAVAGAGISAKNEGTGEAFSTRSTEVGAYTLPALPVDRYTVTVEQAGFKQYTRTSVALTANQVARVDVALDVGSVNETVKVTAELSQVNTATSTLDTMIDDRRLEDLPLNGRNALSVASPTPGVQRSRWPTDLPSGSRRLT